jgi:hypothetical protein
MNSDQSRDEELSKLITDYLSTLSEDGTERLDYPKFQETFGAIARAIDERTTDIIHEHKDESKPKDVEVGVRKQSLDNKDENRYSFF